MLYIIIIIYIIIFGCIHFINCLWLLRLLHYEEFFLMICFLIVSVMVIMIDILVKSNYVR